MNRSIITALAVTAMLVTGCGSDTDPTKESSMKASVSSLSLDAAKARAQQSAQAAAGMLAPGATLEEYDVGGGVTYCSDRSGPPPGTPVQWDSSYQVQGVDPDVSLLDSWPKAMAGQGWKRLYGSQAKGNVAVGDDDGFTLVLVVTSAKVSLAAETPCVKPADPDHPLANPSI